MRFLASFRSRPRIEFGANRTKSTKGDGKPNRTASLICLNDHTVSPKFDSGAGQQRSEQIRLTHLKHWISVSIIAFTFHVSPAEAAARIACPTEIEPLVQAMLPDLPGYANRIIVRSRLGAVRLPRSSVVLAGRPEFQPLPLTSDASGTRDRPIDPTLKQAFITTLEREFVSGKPIELQQFHWLFLTRTSNGWQLALLFTRIGTTTPDQPITPPRESRDGAIGQAIQLWLRDCNAQGIRVRR